MSLLVGCEGEGIQFIGVRKCILGLFLILGQAEEHKTLLYGVYKKVDDCLVFIAGNFS